ncbi:unnamed protein product [Caenorhabditis sp. 36 PRJEB53466]|nr:unnamed protein product [Caenorhabditis sp. 36 PRJEB53466]
MSSSIPVHLPQLDRYLIDVMKEFKRMWGPPNYTKVLNDHDSMLVKVITQNINATFECNFGADQIFGRWNTLKEMFYTEYDRNGRSIRNYHGPFVPFFNLMTWLVVDT